MLTRTNRLTSSRLFAHTARRGRRAGTATLVLHLVDPAAGTVDASAQIASAQINAAQIGFVVSKAVGPAVIRNRVKRRLRHLARERLSSLPGSAVLVVRALPPSAKASFPALSAEFDAALARLTDRGQGRQA